MRAPTQSSWPPGCNRQLRENPKRIDRIGPLRGRLPVLHQHVNQIEILVAACCRLPQSAGFGTLRRQPGGELLSLAHHAVLVLRDRYRGRLRCGP